MPRGDRRAVASIALALTVLLTASACAPQEPEQPTPVPTAVWASGAPTGPLESDAWVIATRASLEAQANAMNRNDFALPELGETTGYDLRTRLFGAARDRVLNAGSTQVSAGPLPFAPIEVEEAPAGDSASVRGCVATEWASEDGSAPNPLSGRGIEYRLEIDGDATRVTSTLNLPDLDCSSVSLPVALFDPAPTASTVTEPSEIIRPVQDGGD
ncbi:hypothetical protein KXS11_00905 [Plantibacter flavus]|uniref:hypothetical protein n=1 Tax=Plantibacter flavus TaxID=150123 RepID=UPI003F16ADD5